MQNIVYEQSEREAKRLARMKRFQAEGEDQPEALPETTDLQVMPEQTF